MRVQRRWRLFLRCQSSRYLYACAFYSILRAPSVEHCGTFGCYRIENIDF